MIERVGGKHLSLIATEDQGHLIAIFIGLRQQTDHGPFGALHPVQRHGATGIHLKNHQRSSLTLQKLGPQIGFLDDHGAIRLPLALAFW